MCIKCQQSLVCCHIAFRSVSLLAGTVFHADPESALQEVSARCRQAVSTVPACPCTVSAPPDSHSSAATHTRHRIAQCMPRLRRLLPSGGSRIAMLPPRCRRSAGSRMAARLRVLRAALDSASAKCASRSSFAHRQSGLPTAVAAIKLSFFSCAAFRLQSGLIIPALVRCVETIRRPAIMTAMPIATPPSKPTKVRKANMAIENESSGDANPRMT